MNKSHLTLRCRDCGLYSHTACSRVTLQELYDLLDEYNDKRKKMNANDDVDSRSKYRCPKWAVPSISPSKKSYKNQAFYGSAHKNVHFVT